MTEPQPTSAAENSAISWALGVLTARAVGALEASSIPALLLRGPVLAGWIYDSPAERRYLDVDLLVPAGARAGAIAALKGLGLELVLADAAPSERESHAETFRDPGRGWLDLHWTVKGIGADPEVVWPVLSRGRTSMTVEGTRVGVPGEGARALMVALHAAQHAGQRTHSLEDVRRAVERVDRHVWEEAAALAVELDAIPAFAAGIRLAPGGPELLDVLSIAAAPTVDVAVYAAGNVPVLRGLWRLEQASGRDKFGLLARELVPTPAFMRASSPLARRGPLGLGAAYAIRPLWLASRLPSAYRALRRARRREV
jgi:Uncharacterised nucleotidyltransferase